MKIIKHSFTVIPNHYSEYYKVFDFYSSTGGLPFGSLLEAPVNND